LRGERTEARRRTVGDLLKNAEAAKALRLEEQKREQKRRELNCRKEREAYLKDLSKDFPKAWRAIQRTVERGSGLAYDEACRALVDLSEAYSLHASRKTFQQALKKFLADHMRRKTLIQRLEKAGILLPNITTFPTSKP